MSTSAEQASLAGVVLAVGAAPWIGREKATRSAVEHTVSVIAQRCEPIFVVATPGQALPELPVRVVRDETRGQGPLSATARALHAAAEAGAKRAFLCAVDFPFLTPDVIDELTARAAEVDADVVLPWDGSDHYLAAVYRTDLAEKADALVAAGERHIRALVDSVDAQRIVVPAFRAPVSVK
jgi:molybdenum cofactor guanylyltransferase